MGGKVCKPVIDPKTVKTLLGANIELCMSEYARLVGYTLQSEHVTHTQPQGQSKSRGYISKAVFYTHYLQPKLGDHFASPLLDRIYAVACPTNGAQGPVTEDEFIVFYYLCYHAADALLLKFIFNLCDLSANEVVSAKDMEKFLVHLYLMPNPTGSAPTAPGSSVETTSAAQITPHEEKESTLRMLASILVEAAQAIEPTKTRGEYTFQEWREAFESDYRIRVLASDLRHAPEPIVQRTAAENIMIRSQEAAGMIVPLTHLHGFFLDRPIPDEPVAE